MTPALAATAERADRVQGDAAGEQPARPVYQAGQPIPRAPAALAALVREVDGVREWVEANGRFTNPRQKAHLLAQCNAAAAQIAGPT